MYNFKSFLLLERSLSGDLKNLADALNGKRIEDPDVAMNLALLECSLEFEFYFESPKSRNLVNAYRVLKDKIITQIDKYDDKTQDNIVSKTIKWETNIIINNFKLIYYIKKVF